MAVDILIVDDSAATRKILQQALLRAQVPIRNVHEAKDGAEALEKLRDTPVGLILTDIDMPRMDGLELLGSLKADESLQNVPVIIISTGNGLARLQEAVSLGAAGYVHKPFAAEHLREQLAGVLP